MRRPRIPSQFVEPREAFDVVGKELFGNDWQSGCVDDPEDQQHQEALRVLREALKSGRVMADWMSLDLTQDGELTPIEANKEFFFINLKKDMIFHHRLDYLYCSIHREQLREFVTGQVTLTRSAAQKALESCYHWLCTTFQEKSVPTVDPLKTQAKARFPGLTERGFKAARKKAIEKTGRYDLTKPGRRRNQIGS